MLLPLEDYKKIINSMPILCIDSIILNSENQYLLVKRKNEPLKSKYWVPGGRIFHYENLDIALNRVLLSEVNINAQNLNKKFVGIYQDFFNENAFNSKSKYHTISIVFQISLVNDYTIKLDYQSEDYIWANELPERFLNKIIK